MQHNRLLVWLPSPMGDAILCTPALRAIRRRFESYEITFIARPAVRDVLSPSGFNDDWIIIKDNNILKLARELRKRKFTTAVLFKNSLASALIVFMAGIENRIGYSREGRGIFLTEKLHPPKLPNSKFRPVSMIDYYLCIASWLGAETENRKLELTVAENDKQALKNKLPHIFSEDKPIMILVPGGAFGLSKCWPAERFAQTADRLIENYQANVVISVSPDETERKIAEKIIAAAKHDITNLGETPLTLGELKALFSTAQLAICNDTGPRHIAIAMGCKVITMFGPNDPAWTQTGYEKEVQIIGRAPCAPCLKPKCSKAEHLCMNSITVEKVCGTVDKLLKGQDAKKLSDTKQQFTQLGDAFFIDEDYGKDFSKAGLTSIESVFSFDDGNNLSKENLADYRSRIEFHLGTPAKTMYLKRYENPPLNVQMENCLSNHGPVSCGLFDLKPTRILNAAGVNTPKIIAYGQEMNGVLEKRSFLITEKVPDAQSLEKKLPDYFEGLASSDNLPLRRRFISRLAGFIKSFHYTGFRHRDLYLCHIFCDNNETLTLIDLARTFQPWIFEQKFLIKDIAQLNYSAPVRYFSRTDRLRFYKIYKGRKKLTTADKQFIRQVISKVEMMARHDKKHGKLAPFKDIK